MNELDEEMEKSMVDGIVGLLPAAPLALVDLAMQWGVEPTDRVFRLAVWRSIERFREETGVQLRQLDGEIVPTTPNEQLAEARKRFVTAGNRIRRGGEIAHAAAKRDPALLQKVERMLSREAVRSAPTAKSELRALEQAHRDALVAGGKGSA